MADLIGSALAIFSPQRALKRAEARWRLDRVNAALAKRDYDGAQTGRRWGGWRGKGSSANAEIAKAHDRLKFRGRDLVRNDPLARRAKNVLVGELVGTGIVMSSATGDDALDDKVDELFKAWSRRADAGGLETLDGLIALAVAGMIEGGDTFIRRRWRKTSDGLPVPMQIQLMEGDFLDSSFDGRDYKGLSYKSGVGFDGIEARRSYRLFKAHPGDAWSLFGSQFETVDVDARDVIHLFLQERAGQVRGVSWFAPSVTTFRDLGDYREAALVKKKTESLFGVAIESAEAEGGTPALSAQTNAATKAADEPLVEELYPGMILRTKPGEKATAFAPSAVAGDYDTFMMNGAMTAGVGMMVTYDQISGDLRGANFSSMKVGKSVQRRWIEQMQELLLIPRLCETIWGWFIEAAVAADKLPARDAGYPVECTPPSPEPVQPKEDQEADFFSMLSGRLTPKQYIEKWGYPFRRQIKNWQAAMKAMKAVGMELPPMPGAAAKPDAAKPAS